jgi:hypothetical protein
MNITPEVLESVSVSHKVHEGNIVENGYTVNECTREKEPEREVNPEWGRKFKGFLYAHRSIL